MGGDDDAVTIAKFLRYYNPGLIGASVGEHIVEVRIHRYTKYTKLVASVTVCICKHS